MNSSSSSTNKRPAKAGANRRRRQRKLAKRKATNQVALPPVGNRALIHVSDCTKTYMKALVDPFRYGHAACIPDTIVLPSHKYSARCTGVFSTGTNGFGFVYYDPFKLATTTGAPASGGFITCPGVFTLPTYPGTGISRTVAGSLPPTGCGFINNSNSPYSFTTWSTASSNVHVRLVASAIKIRYIGSDFRNQGRVILFRQNGNGNIPDGLVPTTMLTDPYTTVQTVSRKEQYIYYTPDTPALLAYTPIQGFYASNQGVDHFAYAICVDGGDIQVPQSWEFEIVSHFEAMGPSLALTASEGDPVGFNQVLASLPTTAPTANPDSVYRQVWNSFTSGLTEGATYVMNIAGRAAAPMVANAGVAYMVGRSQTPRIGL